MKHFVSLFVCSVLLILLSACAKPDLSGENPTVLPEAVPLSATTTPSAPAEVVSATSTVVLVAGDTTVGEAETAVSTPITSPTSFPTITPTPVSTAPTFTNLHFTSADSNLPQNIFASGVEEIAVVWDYANMSAADTVRRVWHYNGEEWLVREDIWDMEQYGENGRISDVSIYNFNGTGLTQGEYTLFLYINNTLVIERTFFVGTNTNPPPVANDTTAPTGPATVSNLRFEADGISQPSFPYGTKEVFAIWDYANIPDKAQLEIVWTYSFYERQQSIMWRTSIYGVTGSMTNVSYKDLGNTPLEPGLYTLTVSLNGAQQLTGSFIIDISDDILAYPNQTGSLTVYVLEDTIFTLAENGDRIILGTANELPIGQVVWFPDGEYILYEVPLPLSEDSDQAWYHLLYIVNVVTRATINLTIGQSFEENLHDPVISPDGRFIAFWGGSGNSYSDCTLDLQVHIMVLNEQKQYVDLYNLEDFTGLVAQTSTDMRPVGTGYWDNNGAFVTRLETVCPSQSSGILNGVYQFFPATLQVERISD